MVAIDIGIALPTYLETASPTVVREAALMAEDLGYSSVWVPDHVLVPAHTHPYESILEAVSTLSWVAGFTKRVRLGLSTLVLPQRDPVLVAKQLATLDYVSEGRVIVGIGAGWVREEFNYLGADFNARGRVMDADIGVLRALWSGASDVEIPGRVIRGASFLPLPAQHSGPQIWIGGSSRPALRRAARLGDGWHGGAAVGSPELFRACVAQLRALAPARDIALSVREHIGDRTGWRTGTFSDEYVLGERDVDSMLALRDAGCSHIVANFWDGDPREHRERIKRFSKAVLPELRRVQELAGGQ